MVGAGAAEELRCLLFDSQVWTSLLEQPTAAEHATAARSTEEPIAALHATADGLAAADTTAAPKLTVEWNAALGFLYNHWRYASSIAASCN